MKKNIQSLVVVFAILLLAYGVYLVALLYTSKKSAPLNQARYSSATKEVPAGEIVVEKVDDPSVPFEEQTIHVLWIKDFRKYLSESGEIPMVDLELGYKEGGAEKTIFVTMVGDVYLSEHYKKDGKYYLDSKGKVSVDSIPYRKGEYIALDFAYFSESGTKGESELGIFCKIKDDPICKAYPTFGFGRNPVSDNFLNEVKKDPSQKFDPSQFAVRSFTRNFAVPSIAI